jgi:hypothetical protein
MQGLAFAHARFWRHGRKSVESLPVGARLIHSTKALLFPTVGPLTSLRSSLNAQWLLAASAPSRLIERRLQHQILSY